MHESFKYLANLDSGDDMPEPILVIGATGKVGMGLIS
jgi:NADPH:quinone reductase-like Zn-dependent oxidoreductase